MSINLIIDSDLHFENGQIRADKINHEDIIAKISRTYKIDAMICAGDLTENGYDGKKILCWQYGGSEDQLTPLKEFVQRMEKITPVYLCMGNHDNYVPWPYLHKGVADYIRFKHGDLIYSWTLNGYRFICLGVYPDQKSINFLKQELKSHSNKKFILYFHFCITGGVSDWWTDREKNTFYDTIKNYEIKLIIVGHRHENWLDSWNGIPVVSGAGSKVVLCQIRNNNIDITEFSKN